MQRKTVPSTARHWYTDKLLLLSAAMLIGIASSLLSLDAMGMDQAPIKLPSKYREWKLISVAHEAGNLNDIRAILGNDTTFHAFRNGLSSLPDGAMIARLAYRYISSIENNKAFGRDQSFVAGSPTNIQIMIKDSRKFSTTGGWGYAQFADPKASNSVDQAAANQCFVCHKAVKDRDYVFTRYLP